jgi:hypothetical protein
LRYKNPDPFEKEKAEEVIAKVTASYDEIIDDCIKRNFYNRQWSTIAKELRYDVYDALSKAFNQRRLDINFNYTEASADNLDHYTAEWDQFWNDVVIHDLDSDSVKKRKMKQQDKLRGIARNEEEYDQELAKYKEKTANDGK